MTLKELDTDYCYWKGKDNLYRLYDKHQSGRMNYKYLCKFYKKGVSIAVEGYSPTTKLEVFKEQVRDYTSKLEWDSEYYNPDVRKGFNQECFVIDYLKTLEFKYKSDVYIKEAENPFGFSQKIILSFSEFEQDIVKINLQNPENHFTWIELKVNNDFQSLKNGIDSLLKPFYLFETFNNFQIIEKLGIENLDFTEASVNIAQFSVEKTDFKSKLITELEKALNILKQ